MPSFLLHLVPLAVAICISGTLPLDAVPTPPSGTTSSAAEQTATTHHKLNAAETQPTSTTYEGLNQTENEYINAVLLLVNQARAEEGLPALKLDPTLQKAAQIRAAECTVNFSHTRPDGTSYETAITQTGVTSGYTGESVAIGQTSPQQVVERWLGSEMHRSNILNEDFTRVGIGLEPAANGYEGFAWVQVFAQ